MGFRGLPNQAVVVELRRSLLVAIYFVGVGGSSSPSPNVVRSHPSSHLRDGVKNYLTVVGMSPAFGKVTGEGQWEEMASRLGDLGRLTNSMRVTVQTMTETDRATACNMAN